MLSEKLEKTLAKLDKLKLEGNDVILQNIEGVKYASEEEISELKNVLFGLSKNVIKFNKEFEENMKPKIGRGNQDSQKQSALGSAVSQLEIEREQFDEITG